MPQQPFVCRGTQSAPTSEMKVAVASSATNRNNHLANDLSCDSHQARRV
jgi:hypothetical protein